MPRDALVGCLLGIAVGDALGLPYEGLSPQRARKLLGEPDRMRLWFGRGMVSDDTEHACLVAQALIASGGDPDRFTAELGRRLRRWFLTLPAGIGRATARACLKLCIGISPRHSGVFSAGNGLAMRNALLGVAIDDLALLRHFVQVSTRITHTDPKAEYGALAVAFAAHWATHSPEIDVGSYQRGLNDLLHGEPAGEFLQLIDQLAASLQRGESSAEFATSLGLARGISGYVYHTVPVALHAWFRSPRDYRSAVMEIIRCGGDADTTAAIVGGIVGATVGKKGIPSEWLSRIHDWPCTITWMERLAEQLDEGNDRAPELFVGAVLLRNIFFLLIVLAHGFRRLLPPY